MEHLTVPFEIKGVDLEKGEFTGYAAIFDNIDLGNDLIERGAFTKTLQENGHRIKICWQHDTKEPIGKPIELREDSTGLFVKGKVSQTTRGRDALILMRDGVVTEFSIGYDSVKYKFNGPVRHLKEVKLWEISPVTFAMNPSAGIIAVKAMNETELLFDYTINDADVFDPESLSIMDIEEGVKGIIGRAIDNENKTLTHSLVFAKDMFTAEEVKAWFEEHPEHLERQEVNEMKSRLKDRFLSEHVSSNLYRLFDVLQGVIREIINDGDVTDNVSAVAIELDAFKEEVMKQIAEKAELPMETSSAQIPVALHEVYQKWMEPPTEEKAGAVLSKSNRELIMKCQVMLKALLDATEPSLLSDTPEAEKTGLLHIDGAGDNHSKKETEVGAEEIHSEIEGLLLEMKNFVRR